MAHTVRDRAAELQAEVRSAAIRVLQNWCPRPPPSQQQQQQQHHETSPPPPSIPLQGQSSSPSGSGQNPRGETVLMSPQSMRAPRNNQPISGASNGPVSVVVSSSTSSSMRPPPPPPPPRVRNSTSSTEAKVGHHEEPTSSIPDLGEKNH